MPPPPTPEELGIRLVATPAPAPEALDWTMVHALLDKGGATGFRLEKHPQGYRFVVEVGTRTLDGIAATQPEAVRIAMRKLQAK